MGKVRKVYPSDVTDEEWWFVLPYFSFVAKMLGSGGMMCARSSTRFVIWLGVVVRGAWFRAISRLGLRCISSFGAGWTRVCSRCW
jgi:hypothetical protein